MFLIPVRESSCYPESSANPYYQTDSACKSNILFAWKGKLQMCRTLDGAVVLSLPGLLVMQGFWLKTGWGSAENTLVHTAVLLGPHFPTLSPSHKVMGPVYDLTVHAQSISGDSVGVKRPSVIELVFAAQWNCAWGNNTPLTNLSSNVKRAAALHLFMCQLQTSRQSWETSTCQNIPSRLRKKFVTSQSTIIRAGTDVRLEQAVKWWRSPTSRAQDQQLVVFLSVQTGDINSCAARNKNVVL